MNNYRILSKEEADYWSNKVFSQYYPYKFSHSSLPQIYSSDSIRRDMNYRFVFSIAKNNIQRFENLLNQFLKEGCRHTLFEDNNRQYVQNFEFDELEKFKGIEIIEEHKTYGVDFIKYIYEFKRTPLLQTIFFIQTLKDVINIIGNFWGFDENGNETCSIKYPVGSIVSTKDNKSDFFVESINFIRKDTLNFKELKNRYTFSEELILYNLLEIVNNNSQVLEYSDTHTTSSDFIIPNRGQRLDELLN